MTILQGTMQDGTVLPVQVDAQGRLVAEGLQGPPGPGFVLPPNPQAGDLLGWNGTELVWVTQGGGPVIPPGGGGGLDVEDVFRTHLYAGNGATQSITDGIDLAGEGGLIWTKCRSAVRNHHWVDTLRGPSNFLQSNGGNPEETTIAGIEQFNSDGYSIGGNYPSVNEYGLAYASWTFRKAEKFFDVVTYVGNGTAGRTVAHNLGGTPGMIIVKSIDQPRRWTVWHRRSNGADGAAYLYLDGRDAKTAGGSLPPIWGDDISYVAPGSSSFTVGSSPSVNANGENCVAYIFAHDAGGFGEDGTESVIKCGTVSDPGSTVSVDLGWEPQWVLLKRTDDEGDWVVIDNMRGWADYPSSSARLFPNIGGPEDLSEAWGNPTATGFLLAASAPGAYIYIAIRRGPMAKLHLGLPGR